MKQLDVDIGGTTYVLSSDDAYLDSLAPGFEPQTVKLLNALVRPGDVALDIGANIGCTALLIAQKAAKVLAFEPSPTTHRFLSLNTHDDPKITAFNFGLGDQAGESKITYAPSSRAGGFVSDKLTASSGHVVEDIAIRRLDDLKLGRFDFVKIDVEGFEGHVLRGGAKAIARSKPVVTLELNHWCLNVFQRTSLPDFLDQLRSIFPVLLAVEGETYLDLHSPDDSYTVMFRHVLEMKYVALVAAFDSERLHSFRGEYRHGL